MLLLGWWWKLGAVCRFMAMMNELGIDDADADDDEFGESAAEPSPDLVAQEAAEGLTVLETDACILCQEATDATSDRAFGLAVMAQPTVLLR